MVNQTTTTTMSSSNQPVNIDALLSDELYITPYTESEYNESEKVETFDHLSGDDYADAMMKELGM